MSKAATGLVVAPEYPYPPIDGHKVRVYNLVKHLPHDVKFDFLAFGEEESLSRKNEMLSKLGSSCHGVDLISEGTLEPIRLRCRLESLRNILFPYETSIGSPYVSQTMARTIEERITSGRYDLIYFCGLYISLHHRQRFNRVPYVIDICDCLSLLARSYYKSERRPIHKIKKYLNYIWADRYEKLHVSKIDNIIMISSSDAEVISGNCPQSKIWVVPNGVDTDYFKRRSALNLVNGQLLFTGVMDYPPNDLAMHFFIKKIFPLIRQKRPNATLTIAGRNPTEELRLLAQRTDGVNLTGFVEDIRPCFETASVYVCPIVSGAGIKNKILEAWSMEVPIVATALSCSGIKVRDNDNILVADEPEIFARKILALLNDEKWKESIGKAGRRTAEEEYSWHSRGRLLASIWHEVSGR
jgi:glycosyltransferase involved in cell wall biosynthesis